MPEASTPERCFGDLLAGLPVPQYWRAELRRRMTGPTRHYHDHRHVGLLWERFLAYGGALGAADPVRRRIGCAIAFHDAVYDSRAGDNEARSAALWREAAAATRLPAEEIDWVAATIEATADHLAAARRLAVADRPDAARQLVLDLDLTPLGEARDVFDRNTTLLRAEYVHVPEVAWRRSRAAFLARLLAAPQIYRTPAIAAVFEAPARANLTMVLAAETG